VNYLKSENENLPHLASQIGIKFARTMGQCREASDWRKKIFSAQKRTVDSRSTAEGEFLKNTKAVKVMVEGSVSRKMGRTGALKQELARTDFHLFKKDKKIHCTVREDEKATLMGGVDRRDRKAARGRNAAKCWGKE